MSETAKQEVGKGIDMAISRAVLLDQVVVFNSHLVHPAFLDIMEMALDDEEYHGLKAIFISEKKSAVEDYGWYVPELDAIVMNLPNVLSKTIKGMQENETGLSIAAAIWVNMVWTFFHELHHAVAWTVDAEACKANREGQEEEAGAYAEEMLNIVVDNDNAEGPALEEMPWFKEHAVKALAVTDRKFMEKQAEMMEKGLLFDHAGVQHTSMKEYFKDAKNGVTEMENDAIELELKTESEKPVDGLKQAEQSFQTPQEVQPMQQMGQEGTCYDMPDEDMTVQPGAEVANEYNKLIEAGGGEVITEQPERAAAVMTNGTQREAAIKLWLVLYNQIFANNGFNGQTYVKENMLVNVPIPADIASHGFITGCRPDNGGWIQANAGYVVGRYFKADKSIPGYDIGVLQGQTRKVFRLIAQNPNTGSQYASRARQGAKIAWLIDTSADKWIAKIDNGTYERV